MELLGTFDKDYRIISYPIVIKISVTFFKYAPTDY